MRKRKLLSLLVLLMTAATGAWAQQTPHWSDVESNIYEHSQTLYAAITIDGTVVTAEYGGWESLEVAAFVDDERRSGGYFLKSRNNGATPVLNGMSIYYNNPGELITFKIFDHANDTETEYTAWTVTYSDEEMSIRTGEQIEGTPRNPVFLNFTTSQLHLEVDPDDNTSAYLMYSPVPEDCPYYDGYNEWSEGIDYFMNYCTEIIVDESCRDYDGTSLSCLFYGFLALGEINNLDNLNTSSVTNMSHMFEGCSTLGSLDLGDWDTGSVTDMSSMFEGCTSLTGLDLGGWDTHMVEDMYNMFDGCSSLGELNLSGWYTGGVTDMSSMFYGCESLTDLALGVEWDTANVTDMSDMFYDCPGLCYDVEAKEGDEGEYWATFYAEASGYNFQAPEGTLVFMVSLSGTTITMTEIENRVVKSGEGVVLKSIDSDITLEPTLSVGYYEGNDLEGTTEDMDNPGGAYVLNYKAATGAGFYKLSTTGTIGANKAYLVYDDSDGARPFFSFNEATSINEELKMKNEEFVTAPVYDLQGRRVSQPTQKGLYIVNGKKYIKK